MDSARLGILLVMLFLPNASTTVRTLAAFIFAFLGCCIIRPQILIVAPAKIKLTVRGTRVVARISHCCESP
jgi:ABC-type enterochelin transport system permease subunit